MLMRTDKKTAAVRIWHVLLSAVILLFSACSKPGTGGTTSSISNRLWDTASPVQLMNADIKALPFPVRTTGSGVKQQVDHFAVSKSGVIAAQNFSGGEMMLFFPNGTHRALHPKQGEAEYASSLYEPKFSPDGLKLAVGSDDGSSGGTVRIFDVKSAREARIFKTSVAMSASTEIWQHLSWMPDSQTVIATGGTVKLLDLKSKAVAEPAVLLGREGSHYALWSPTEGNGLRRDWDIQEAASTSPGGNTVVAAGQHGISVWSIHHDAYDNGSLPARVLAPEVAYIDLMFTLDGRYVIACSDKGDIDIWRTSDWRHEARVGVVTTPYNGQWFHGSAQVRLSPDGQYAAVIYDGMANAPVPGITMIDLRRGQIVGHLRAPYGPIAFSPDSQTLLLGGTGGLTRYRLVTRTR